MRPTIIAGLAALVAVGLGLGAFLLVYTPTATLRIRNDTPVQVTLAGCSSDPATVSPDGTVTIDPNANDPRAVCSVFRGETRQLLGCLEVPTTVFHNGAVVDVSDFKRASPHLC